tara:strand:+ start:9409 stop:12792 length:3384 start_codon:yes stop_codon:yes gene_type:complete
MKTLKLLLIGLTIFLTVTPSFAQDTTVVQTLEFSDITKRRGWYVFPSDTNEYQKILMYYTLKCDAATTQDGYTCGEWDYTTYTNLYEYKNIGQPYYGVNGIYPDSIFYTTIPTNTYYQSYQDYIVYDNTVSETDYTLGSGSLTVNHPLNSSISNSKTQYLFTAAELTTAGLTSGNIDKLKLDINSLGSNANHLTIKIKNTVQPNLTTPETTGFTEVFHYNSNLTLGTNSFNFTTPYNWDGISNIIVEVSHTNTTLGTNSTVNGSDVGFNSTLYSITEDGYLNFDRADDYISIPDNNSLDFTTNFSIEAWVKPTAFNANSWENTIVGKDSDENSGSGYVLRCGGNGILNFNLGTAAGWKEVTSSANALTLNTWQHVAATYDGATLKIYVNGIQVGTAANGNVAKINSMDLNIGAGYNGGGRKFNGKIDEVRLWSTALSPTSINNWRDKVVDGTHPNYANLTAYYNFNDEQNVGLDISTNNFSGTTFGFPTWASFNGSEMIKGFISSSERPNITFTQGDYASHLDSTLITDTIQNPQIAIVENNTSKDLNVSSVALTPVDTIYAWASGWSYVYDENGNVTDSIYNNADATLVNNFEQNTFQLQNYVTPYGIGLNLGPNGFRWVYDVTDYASLFHDTLEISAGNQQELIDLKFIMIKGTPPRKAIDIDQIWLGDWQHADIANDVVLPSVNFALNGAATQYKIKTRTTGHWFGGFQNCAEFCPKYHHLKINGNKEFEWLNWKSCADNPVIAQGGTWIYDRAGWCPGTFGDTYDHELTPFVTPGSNVNIDYGMDITAGGMEGNYRTSVQLVSYGPTNFTLDARIDEIISPNDWEFHNRVNPICDDAKIVIQNTGSTTLTSLKITYNVMGGSPEIYTWTGTLNFMEREEVILPIPTQAFWVTASSENIFEVSVSEPNGLNDEYADNNNASAKFEMPDIFDSSFYIELSTNLAAYENSYTIKNDQGTIVASRSGMANSTLYKDTIDLPNGCYVFDFLDTGNDGLSFFANNDGNGGLKFKDIPVPLTIHSFPSNFGSFIKYYFVMDAPTGIEENKNADAIIYPNPSNGIYNIYLKGFDNDTEIEVFNTLGKKVLHKYLTNLSGNNTINLENESDGIYFVRITSNNKSLMKQLIKQ